MSAKDVRKLIKEARDLKLICEEMGDRWKITNPVTGFFRYIPGRAIGRGLANAKTTIRHVKEGGVDAPAPMRAAVGDPTQREQQVGIEGHSVATLLLRYLEGGGHADVRGGLLHLTGPPELEPMAAVLLTHEAEVTALVMTARRVPAPPELAPPVTPPETTPASSLEAPVPRIRDAAHVQARPDIAADARTLYELLREQAREQGDEPGANAGVMGVLWEGAMSSLMRAVAPEWDDYHRQQVSLYLEQSGHTRCQSRNSRPPIWWLAETWNDGGLTISRRGDRKKPAPTPAALARQAAPPAPPPAPATAVVNGAGGPGNALNLLKAVEQRISDAERRAKTAEAERADAIGERDQALALLADAIEERDAAKAELSAINTLFTSITGGTT
ncbi:hypothetical protein [Spongiactinospora sp. TRM90649]|uniref:hypothetical protein n=1 Tax=Spongiactinospora sp. TRM90649 TaxID=3031114 RepID=UPI0023F89C03|nr:hypothetical protein [Spongiactinospora sp. TRM90649]MDF5756616.1 hypothetical protein [Spongiactinospora sp. TRM90649]